MRIGLRLGLLACVVLLTSCTQKGLQTDLPLVVTETGPQGAVQVTVDPEGTVLTNRGGTTTRQEASDADMAELRRLMTDADLDSLDGGSAESPKYIVLAGDAEIFLGPTSVPNRLVPVLTWIDEHRG